MKIISAICAALLVTSPAFAADSAEVAEKMEQMRNKVELDAAVNKSLVEFKSEVPDAENVLKQAKAYLVFPKITKAGLGIGGEYGEGALIKDGKTIGYYDTTAASIGLQAGVETKSMVMAFMEESALDKFQKSSGWEVGVDGAVTVIDQGATGKINTTITNQPIVAFVYGKSGLMADVSLSGSKFSKVEYVG
jgi:lipid-binding SYLF domain-containing protein